MPKIIFVTVMVAIAALLMVFPLPPVADQIAFSAEVITAATVVLVVLISFWWHRRGTGGGGWS